MLDVGGMLGGDDDGVDRVGPAVDVADGDLRLRVGPQPGQAPVAAQVGLAFHDPVREEDRQRHHLRRLVAGVAEHETLVSGALLEVQALSLGHALRDIRGLLVVGHQDRAAPVVDAEVGIVVADALDGLARDLVVIDVGARGYFPREHHQARVHQRFRSDPGGLVLR